MHRSNCTIITHHHHHHHYHHCHIIIFIMITMIMTIHASLNCTISYHEDDHVFKHWNHVENKWSQQFSNSQWASIILIWSDISSWLVANYSISTARQFSVLAIIKLILTTVWDKVRQGETRWDKVKQGETRDEYHALRHQGLIPPQRSKLQNFDLVANPNLSAHAIKTALITILQLLKRKKVLFFSEISWFPFMGPLLAPKS